MSSHRPSPRRRAADTALFVRIPSEHARRLDRAAFELGRSKRELVSGLVERYVDPDSSESLAELSGAPGDRRRVTVETLDPGGMTLGHHSFRPREPEVLTAAEAAELLQVDDDIVLELADRGELPGRRLGGEWRFARSALLAWLAADDDAGAGPAGDPR